MRIPILPLAALLICVALHNLHGIATATGAMPDNVVFNTVVGDYQFVTVDISEGPTRDPRNFWRFCIQLGYGATFLLLLWESNARSLGVFAMGYFALQAAEVYLTGNIFASDWPDWITLCAVITAWLLWLRFSPTLKVVWRRK